MIGFLKGYVFKKEVNKLLLDVSGVGYNVFMTEPMLESLLEGSEAFLYIYYQQKEDSVSLFGFLSEDTKSIFEMLIDLNGVGPKLALAILGHLSDQGLIRAVRRGDLDVLVSTPGVGKKTAQRLILELQDKMSDFDYISREGEEELVAVPSTGLIGDAIEALVFLGYTKNEVEKIVLKLSKRNSEHTVNSLIKEALKELGR